MSHDLRHGTGNDNRSFATGVILNRGFVAIIAGYGIFTGSLALMADAGHSLSDVVSLLLASGSPSTPRQHSV